jgi:hypothetical protein
MFKRNAAAVRGSASPVVQVQDAQIPAGLHAFRSESSSVKLSVSKFNELHALEHQPIMNGIRLRSFVN